MTRNPHIAYFCMEYGLHESFPIYSGGLGVLAGDFIKAARDLRLPMVAVGLLWPWLSKVGIGRLPGDIVIERENFRLYLPITTSILVSIVLSLILRWFGR